MAIWHELLRRRILPILLITVISGPHLIGQVFLPQEEQRAGQFVDPSRAIRQVLRDGEEAAKEKRWGEVVLLIGELLSRPNGIDPDDPLAGEDFFLDATNSSTLHTESLRRFAEGILGSMPAEGLQTYRQHYGPEASRMLTQATQSRDWDQLVEVSRRFLHTEAGYEATMLLAGRELSRGLPLAAALILERLNDSPAAKSQLGNALPELLTYAWQLADQPQRVSGAAAAPTPKAIQEQTQQWIHRFAHPNTIVNGGSAGRIGEGNGALPLQHPKWKSFLASDPQEESILESLRRKQLSGGGTAIPSWRPLVAGRYVLARNTERLVGIDLQDGNQVWHFPYGDTDPGFQDSEAALDNFGSDNGAELLEQRVWHDLPYGQITSDGQRAFMLDELLPFERITMGGFGGIGGFNVRQGVRSRDNTTCALVAVDLTTEGKLLWSISGRDTEQPGLRGAFFLGPPLPLQGKLYCIIEIGGDTYLACLRAEDGMLQWRQHLTTSEAGSVANDPLRRMIGAVPSMADGVLVCPTGQGTVVAMDLATRTLRWALTLSRASGRQGYSTHPFQRGGIYDVERLVDRWLDGIPVIADGSVLLTPPESDELYCIDIVTGELRFPKMQRDDWWCIAGVRNGRFFLLGDKSIAAFDLRTGSKAWSKPVTFPDGHRAAGRGVFGQNSYIVATTGGALHEYDLGEGELLGSVKVDYPVGNLIATTDSLVVQGVKEIGSSYLGGERLQEAIETRLALNPKDFWALTRKSEGLIEQGNLLEAVNLLRQAREAEPKNEEVRMLLVESMLGLVQNDIQSHANLATELEKLTDLPEERVELLRVLADGAILQEDFPKAIERLTALSKLVAANVQGFPGALDEEIEIGDRQIALDDWVAARVEDIKRELPPEQMASIQKPIEDIFRDSSKLSVPLKERLLRQFGTLSVSDTLRRELIIQWIRDHDYFPAERTLFEALEGTVSTEKQRTWNLLLARLYAEAGWAADAKEYLRAGESEGGEATTEELGGVERSVITRAVEDAEPIPDLKSWPKHVHVTPRPEAQPMTPDADLLEVVHRRGHYWKDWQVGDSGAGELRLIDPQGQTHTIINLSGTKVSKAFTQCTFDGGLLLVLMPTEIIAVDLFSVLQSSDVLWRKQISLDGQSATRAEPRILGHSERETLVAATQAPMLRFSQVRGRRSFAFLGGRFCCINLLDGSEAWSFSSQKSELAAVNPRSLWPTTLDDRFAIVASNEKHWWTVDPNDGAILGEHDWNENKGVLQVDGPRVLWVTPGKEETNPQAGLYDLQSQQNLHERNCTLWTSVNDRWQVLLDSGGELEILDSETGKLIAKSKIESEKPIESIAALRHGENLIILTMVDGVPQRINPYGQQVNGPIVSISLATGELQWKSKMEDVFGCLMNQTKAWPLLIFSRERPNDTGRRTGEVVAMDVRTGALIGRKNGFMLDSQASYPAVDLNLDEKVGLVRFGRTIIEYQFSDEPPAAEAVDAKEKGPQPSAVPEPFGLFQPFGN